EAANLVYLLERQGADEQPEEFGVEAAQPLKHGLLVLIHVCIPSHARQLANAAAEFADAVGHPLGVQAWQGLQGETPGDEVLLLLSSISQCVDDYAKHKGGRFAGLPVSSNTGFARRSRLILKELHEDVGCGILTQVACFA